VYTVLLFSSAMGALWLLEDIADSLDDDGETGMEAIAHLRAALNTSIPAFLISGAERSGSFRARAPFGYARATDGTGGAPRSMVAARSEWKPCSWPWTLFRSLGRQTYRPPRGFQQSADVIPIGAKSLCVAMALSLTIQPAIPSVRPCCTNRSREALAGSRTNRP
jgi:hypothetical protein